MTYMTIYRNLGWVRLVSVPPDRISEHLFIERKVTFEAVKQVLEDLGLWETVAVAVNEIEGKKNVQTWIYFEYPRGIDFPILKFLDELDKRVKNEIRS